MTDNTPLIIKSIQRDPDGVLHWSANKGPGTGTSGRSFLAEIEAWTPEVWVATNQWPESDEIFVARDRDALLGKIRDSIGQDAWDEFVATLKDDEVTDVQFTDDAEKVLTVWAGPIERLEDGSEFLGGDFFIRKMAL